MFSSDTRALQAVCVHAQVDYDLNIIDTLAKMNQQADYLDLNPTGAIPMLIHKQTKVIAPCFQLFEWVLKTSEKAEQIFHHEDQTLAVTAIQRYFYREMRGNTSQLIRRLAMKILNPDKAPNPNDPKAKERLQTWIYEFDSQLLEKLNLELSKPNNEYLTGAKVSVIDIVVHQEIHQVLAMYDRQLPQHLTKMHEWYEKVGEIEAVKNVSAEFNKVLDLNPQLKETTQ